MVWRCCYSHNWIRNNFLKTICFLSPLSLDWRQVERPPPLLQIRSIFLVFYGLSHDITLEKKCVAQNLIYSKIWWTISWNCLVLSLNGRIYNRSCWRELGGGIALFCCQKWVGGLGPFGPALKNRHTFLFKSGTMWKPIKKLENFM